MRNFKNYEVWQKAHELVISIYKLTGRFPKNEQYCLVNQMRRSAASIPKNIAEGCGRLTDLDFAWFITIASGSAYELEYQLLLSNEMQYIDNKDFEKNYFQVNEIKKMLVGLHSMLIAFC